MCFGNGSSEERGTHMLSVGLFWNRSGNMTERPGRFERAR